jgi:hypothetical protein
VPLTWNGQTVVQEPQWFGFVERLKQLPLQFTSPVLQVQTALTQLAPVPQAVPQAPQLFESVLRFTQLSLAPTLQSVNPELHELKAH